MSIRMKWMLPALTLALVSGAALAQFLYKSTMPDGRVVYGDAPTPGAVKVEKTRPDTAKTGVTGTTPGQTEALRRLENERATSADFEQGKVGELEAALRKMEADREKVRAPLEGERIGTVGGGGRFTDGYWDRQRKYEEGMDSLRKELDKARAGK